MDCFLFFVWIVAGVVSQKCHRSYKGDFQARKHYLNEARKEVKNRGDMTSWYVENDHTPIVSRILWKKAQNQLDKNRETRHEKSVVGDLNEEIYPYMNHIFCAKCGYPLKRRVYSNGNKMSWYCYGQRRFHNHFCTGVVVPDAVIRSWGELPGNVYIRKEVDELGKATFKYVKESSWSRNHKKKERPVTVEKENDYPYQEHLFCRQCGAKLVKLVYPNGNVFWICSKYKRKGVAACPGVRVPDEAVRGWGIIRKDLYIERRDRKDGTKNYCYSGKKRQDSIKQGRKE